MLVISLMWRYHHRITIMVTLMYMYVNSPKASWNGDLETIQDLTSSALKPMVCGFSISRIPLEIYLAQVFGYVGWGVRMYHSRMLWMRMRCVCVCVCFVLRTLRYHVSVVGANIALSDPITYQPTTPGTLASLNIDISWHSDSRCLPHWIHFLHINTHHVNVYVHICVQTCIQTCTNMYKQTNKPTSKQTNKQTIKQTNKQTKYVKAYVVFKAGRHSTQMCEKST